MNNLRETEKSLKRWLKSKVSITMATVVGFMIAGSVSFGAEGIQEVTWGENVTIEAGETINGVLINVKSPSSQAGNISITNNGTIGTTETAIAIDSNFNNSNATEPSISITNNGSLVAKEMGVFWNCWLTKDNKITVETSENSSITINGDSSNTSIISNLPYGLRGIYVASRPEGAGVINNAGDITVTNSSLEDPAKINSNNVVLGLGAHGAVTATNSGDITVNSNYGRGVSISSGTALANATLDNTGNIVVNGDNAIGAYIEAGDSSVDGKESGTAVVTNNGTIKAKGENVLGAKLVGEYAKLVNNGTIELVGENTTGSGVSVGWGATLENNGTIDAGSNTAIAIDLSLGTLKAEDVSNVTITNEAEKIIKGKEGIVFLRPDNEHYNQAAGLLDKKVTITNNGTIDVTKNGIFRNGFDIQFNEVEITNGGDILVTGDEAAHGMYIATRPYSVENDTTKTNVTNTGSIIVENNNIDLTNEDHLVVKGIRIHEKGNLTNSGSIKVTANGGIGVAMTGGKAFGDGSNAKDEPAVTENDKKEYSYFENTETGHIDVIGNESIGLLVEHQAETEEEFEVSFKAINKGTISVDGNNSIGVKLAATNEGNHNISFTNEGTIVATGEGAKAIYSDVDDLTINLAGNSHIEGVIDLAGDNSLVDIEGVGLEKEETITVNADNGFVHVTNSNVNIAGNITREGEGFVNNEVLPVIRVGNQGGPSTVTNSGIITGAVGMAMSNSTDPDGDHDGQATAKENTVTMINNGTINASLYGIYANGWYQNHNKFVIENNKDIILADGQTESIGISASTCPVWHGETGNTGSVTNNGLISVTAKDGVKAIGMALHENTKGYNTKEIIVDAKDGIGVSVTSGDDGKYGTEVTFENTGKISMIKDGSIGLLVENTAEAGVAKATNDSTGVIEVNGNNSIAVKVSGASAEFTNTGTLVLGAEGTGKKAIVTLDGGVATSTGTIKVEGNELDGVTNKEDAFDRLFDGENIAHTGLIVDKDGKAMLFGEEAITGDIKGEILADIADEEVVLGNARIVTDGAVVEKPSVNIIGEVEVVKGNDPTVVIDADSVNLDKEGKIVVKEETELVLVEGSLNKEGTGEAIEIVDGTLALVNMDVNGNIKGTTDQATVTVDGVNNLNGNYEGLTFDFSNPVAFMALTNPTKTQIVSFNDPTKTLNDNKFIFGGNTAAQVQLATDKDGNTALTKGTGNVFTGTSSADTNNGDLLVKTGSLSGNTAKVNLGDNTFTNVGVVSDSTIYTIDTVLNEGTGDNKDTVVELTYNQDLYKDTNTTINNMNKEAAYVNGYFSQDIATREKQLDNLYANNIYSETARAAYDMMKLNEESVLSLNADTKVGEWVAAGKALYNKTEYDRTGTVGEYTSETETSGLMAGLEYGVNETTSLGVALSGAYQDIDTDNGEADGKLFYLGVYGKKEIGKLKLTAGLGYQYGDYDADNKVASIASSESYDVNAYSAYVEGRYGIDLGDNVTFEPKLKLGYTYVDQDNVSDDYFRLSDSELSTFDAEVGADLVKSIALKSGKLDVRFGASYVRAFGDTDDKFTGSFAGSTGSFDVLGAELSEDTAKFDLGVEVSKDSGVFYNLGGTLRVGSDNTRNYGVKLGAGYKF